MALPDKWDFEKLQVIPQEGEDRLVCHWEGNIHFTNAKDPAADIIEEVHAYVVESKLPKLVHDLIDVPIVNSSGLKAFLQSIALLKRLRESEQYQLIFLYDPDISWQRKHLPELKLMLPSKVRAMTKDDHED